MDEIVEINEHGAIQLPAAVLEAIPLQTRFALAVQGTTLVLQPVDQTPQQHKTPQEQAEAIRRWAKQPRPEAPPLPVASLRREQMYD